MTPKTLEYLKSILTERILREVDEISSESVAVIEGGNDLFRTSTALKEVNRSIRRAENRARRKAKEE